MKRDKILTFILILVSIFFTTNIIGAIPDSTLLDIKLPPIDSLYANAYKENPSVLTKQASAEVTRRQWIAEHYVWFKYLKPSAGYTYGNTANLVSYSESSYSANIPTAYSNNKNTYWNLGVYISLPLNEILNYSNNIKEKKAAYLAAQYYTEEAFQAIQLKIIESYTQSEYLLSIMKSKYSLYLYAKTEFDIALNRFKIGAIESSELVRVKRLETQYFSEYQVNLIEFKKNVLILELLSNTEIIPRK